MYHVFTWHVPNKTQSINQSINQLRVKYFRNVEKESQGYRITFKAINYLLTCLACGLRPMKSWKFMSFRTSHKLNLFA